MTSPSGFQDARRPGLAPEAPFMAGEPRAQSPWSLELAWATDPSALLAPILKPRRPLSRRVLTEDDRKCSGSRAGAPCPALRAEPSAWGRGFLQEDSAASICQLPCRFSEPRKLARVRPERALTTEDQDASWQGLLASREAACLRGARASLGTRLLWDASPDPHRGEFRTRGPGDSGWQGTGPLRPSGHLWATSGPFPV